MTDTSSNPSSRARRWCFRGLAVLLGLSPILVLELVLRLAGFQGAESRELDPFVQFTAVRPLFESSGDQMTVPASRQEYFRPESFSRSKAANEFRIFCLGGSTVQGRPFAIETSFSTWLELSLEIADPTRQWEVVNCGGVSYASYRLKPILGEVLRYQPDLIILYTGHNEFLEERTYAEWRRRPAWLRGAASFFERSKTYCLARSLATPQRPRDKLSAEVDAMLDYREGLEQYHRDDRWQDAVVDHYELNIRQMLDMCREAAVPILVCNPVENLETPPFKSQPQELGNKQQEFNRLRELARKDATSLDQRIALLSEAATLAPRDANIQYFLAKSLQAAHDYAGSYERFIRAKDEDVCPLRMTEPLHKALRKCVAEQMKNERSNVYWCDIRRGFTHPELKPHGGQPSLGELDLNQRPPGEFRPFDTNAAQCIVGDRWLVDHVHPSIHGHQLIASWLHSTIHGMGLIRAAPEDYDHRRSVAYRDHLTKLSPIYFEQAKRRLEGLKRWSEGRAFKVRNPSLPSSQTTPNEGGPRTTTP